MTIKALDHYAPFLTNTDHLEIERASYAALLDLVTDLALSMQADAAMNPIQIDDFWQSAKSDKEKLSLIRGLCDRIESKLIEDREPDRCPCGDELLSTCQGCNGWTMEIAK